MRIILVLASSLDGKLSPSRDQRPGFPSAIDTAHLEEQVSLADATLLGAGTLRAYSSAFLVTNPALLAARAERGQTPQPLAVISSRTLDLPLDWTFFRQPLERLLLTGSATEAQIAHYAPHAEVMACGNDQGVDFAQAMQQLQDRGIKTLVLLGGGNIVAQFFALGLVDEMWLTLCPVIVAGKDSPSAAEGIPMPNNWVAGTLLEMKRVGEELFLHYKFK
jgi:5-amino-6-(5-phosphoribosylamino)uracil reductase